VRRENHFYVYYLSGDGAAYYFDRTMGTERDARRRVQELEKNHRHAVFLKNHLIDGAFY